MLQDRILLHRLKHGSKDALQLIYKRYTSDILNVAFNLLGDRTSAEDALQDAFVSFVQSIGKINLRTNLKGYLITCAANRCRDLLRQQNRRRTVSIDEAEQTIPNVESPFHLAMLNEQMQRLSYAMTDIPYEQREVIVLRLHGHLKFRQIAQLQNVSIKTVQSRYRYGLDRLRSIMNGEVEK
jgi:RNA polymerase sigma-70 factor (ECF subfamily)